MKLSNEKTDEGFVIGCAETGRVLARLHTHTESLEPPANRRVRVALKEPFVHFTGAKLSPAELQAVAAEVARLLKG